MSDVEQTNAPAASAKGETEVRELSSLQSSAARAAAESKATAPHVYYSTRAEMTRCGELAEEGEFGVRELLIRASALALREAPLINAAYRDGRFELYSRANVGFTVAARDSVVLPVIHDADQKSVAEVATEVLELEVAARDGSITRPQLAGATFTVTTVAGVERYVPIITRGQAATLGVGVREAEVTPPEIELTLACDARIAQSAEGSDFLAAVRALLENPEEI